MVQTQKDFQPLTISVQSPILDVSQRSEYACETY